MTLLYPTRARKRHASPEQLSLEQELFPSGERGSSTAMQTPRLEVALYRVQLVREDSPPLLASNPVIRKPEDASDLFQQLLLERDRECFCVMFLNTKNRVIGLNLVSVGILDSALVHPREVFKPAILANAASIILAHNHPSGEPWPSGEDRRVTRTLCEAGKILGIEVLDHIIVGERGDYLSFKELGYL